jgi:phosphate uptake regulator
VSEKENKQWTRKVQKTGGATFIVGLPKDWCEENSITDEHLAKLKDKGQGIEITLVEMNDHTLRIFPPSISIPEDKEVIPIKWSNDQSLDLIRRKIIGHYISGATETVIENQSGKKSTHFSAEAQKTIIDQVGKMMGSEIYENFSDKITIRHHPPTEPIRNQVESLRITATEMLADAIKAFTTKDMDLGAIIVEKEKVADRLYFRILRFLNQSLTDRNLRNELEISLPEVLDHATIPKRLELIADYAYVIVKLLEEEGAKKSIPRINKHFTTFANLLNKKITASVEIYYAQDSIAANDLIEEVLEEIKRFRADFKKVLGEVDTITVLPIILVKHKLERCAQFLIDIAEIAIDRKIRD